MTVSATHGKEKGENTAPKGLNLNNPG